MSNHPMASLLILLFGLLPGMIAAEPVRVDTIEAELMAEQRSVRPGEPFWVGVRLSPDPNWKTYWRNPGGSGLPTRIDWTLPAGVSAGEIHWPYPQRIEVLDVVSYGYDGETLLLTRIHPSEELADGSSLDLTADVSWLACRDICIPGQATLDLTLPVQDQPPVSEPDHQARFQQTRTRLPVAAQDWSAGFRVQDNTLTLAVDARPPVFADAAAVDFFPYQPHVVDSGAPQQVEASPGYLQLAQATDDTLEQVPRRLEGVLVIHGAKDSAAFALTAVSGVLPSAADTDVAGSTETFSLFTALFLAMLGGLLLNLMPCVFPVLFLKAIGLLEAVHVSEHGHHVHGIAYTLGAMVFFGLMALVLLAIKATGESIGWGFQLQTPWFVALLVYLLFILGLSFSGLLEFGGRFMGVGESLTQRGGYMGSFFTGALAAVVASPCTAPFMGTAVAFAITQPGIYSIMVFLALGFGMALPFLVIAYLPNLGRYLPRPGPWMDIFKQAMAFPLYITAIWLLWVLGRQTSATGMAVVLTGMLLLLFAVWLQHIKPPPKGRGKTIAAGLTALVTVLAFTVLFTPLLRTAPPAMATGEETSRDGFWQAYSPGRVAELRAEGRAVFVNMTADWCISCIANERVALSVASVREAFRDKGIVALKGDWTNGDPAITQVLESFGRSGVPLYVLYPPQGEPRVLPQWLTPGNVLAAVEGLE